MVECGHGVHINMEKSCGCQGMMSKHRYVCLGFDFIMYGCKNLDQSCSIYLIVWPRNHSLLIILGRYMLLI